VTRAAASAIRASRSGQRFVSVATIYELEYKAKIGRLEVALPANWRADIEGQGFDWLPITAVHASAAASLPLHHRDPWDRIIISQAVEDGLVVITADGAFRRYGVRVIW
jgi:PIN domain nuclease of toxin-antitoxin system